MCLDLTEKGEKKKSKAAENDESDSEGTKIFIVFSFFPKSLNFIKQKILNLIIQSY